MSRISSLLICATLAVATAAIGIGTGFWTPCYLVLLAEVIILLVLGNKITRILHGTESAFEDLRLLSGLAFPVIAAAGGLVVVGRAVYDDARLGDAVRSALLATPLAAVVSLLLLVLMTLLSARLLAGGVAASAARTTLPHGPVPWPPA